MEKKQIKPVGEKGKKCFDGKEKKQWGTKRKHGTKKGRGSGKRRRKCTAK